MDTSYFVNEMPKAYHRELLTKEIYTQNGKQNWKNKVAMCNLRFTKKLGYKTDFYVFFTRAQWFKIFWLVEHKILPNISGL